jgi:hypothetical protein
MLAIAKFLVAAVGVVFVLYAVTLLALTVLAAVTRLRDR